MKYGYKVLISEKFLHKVKQRAHALKSFNLVTILYKENELVFKTRSGTPPYKKIWTQRVIIQDLDILKVKRLRFNDLAKFIREANLKISCDCDAFLYWGGKYWAWKKGFGIEKEIRYPRVRQPYFMKYTCKHLYAVLSAYPWWSRLLAKKYKDNLPKEEKDNDLEGVPSDDQILDEILHEGENQ